MRFSQLFVPFSVLLACAPKSADMGDTGSSVGEGEGAEVTSATDGTPTTSGSATSPDPTAPPTSASSATMTATATATSTSTSGTSDTGDDTSSEGLVAACGTVCMVWETCSPGSAGPVDQCTADCIDGFEIPSACAMATAAQWSCVAALPCEEALKFLDGTPSGCLAEVEAAGEACGDIACGGDIGGGDDFCELEQQCDDKSQNYHCDIEANLCTCTENEVEGAQCPADGFCSMDPGEQRAAITACCGWVWM